jgi:ubiquinol-cytochrome c reductase cytochrome c subunit
MRRLTAFLASLVAVTAFLALTPSPAPAADGMSGNATRTIAPDLVDDGERLFAQSCASCHAPDGSGTQNGPSLLEAGAANADFQLRTGRMPFAGQPGEQAKRKPPAFDDAAIEALVAYVASFGNGPSIPEVALDQSLLSRGNELFIANCAACHGATGNGGAVGGGAVAPALDRATPLEVAEAMLIGPGQMPVFPMEQDDVNAVVTYVEHLRTAADPGGFEIGGIGPVPEGFVAWVVGMAALLLVVLLIGRHRRQHGTQQLTAGARDDA